MKQSHAWTRRLRSLCALFGSLLPGCSSDICEGISQSCLSVRLEAGSDQSSDRLRVLVGIDGNVPVERVSKPPGGATQSVSFPITFSVLCDRGGRVSTSMSSPSSRAARAYVPRGRHRPLAAQAPDAQPQLRHWQCGHASSGIPAARHSAGLAYFPSGAASSCLAASTRRPSRSTTPGSFAAEKRWQPLRGLNHPSARRSAGLPRPSPRHRPLRGQAPTAAASRQTICGSSIRPVPGAASTSRLPHRRAADPPWPTIGAPDTLVLVRGRNASQPQPLSDVWELVGDSSTWARAPQHRRASRRQSAHGVRRAVLLIGSDEANPTTLKVWRLDTIFTELPPPGGNTAPIRRNDFAVSFDLSNSALLLFGGTTAGAPSPKR